VRVVTPLATKATAGAVKVDGDFKNISEARATGIAVATDNPRFSEWCGAFEIEDVDGNVISKWGKGDNA
jgi:hypothetical protein